eukprot:13777936-Alexandrium_andersonii.AAC.1
MRPSGKTSGGSSKRTAAGAGSAVVAAARAASAAWSWARRQHAVAARWSAASLRISAFVVRPLRRTSWWRPCPGE